MRARVVTPSFPVIPDLVSGTYDRKRLMGASGVCRCERGGIGIHGWPRLGSAMTDAMLVITSSVPRGTGPQREAARPCGAYFIVGMTNAESSTAPSGQRAVMVLTLV